MSENLNSAMAFIGIDIGKNCAPTDPDVARGYCGMEVARAAACCAARECVERETEISAARDPKAVSHATHAASFRVCALNDSIPVQIGSRRV
jgi:hypothetical protein